MKKNIFVIFLFIFQFSLPLKASSSFQLTQEMWDSLISSVQQINGTVNSNHALLLNINSTVNTINATTTYIAAYGTKTFSKITSETIAGITGLTNEQTVTLALCIWAGLYTAPLVKQFLVDPLLIKAFEAYVFWVDWARNLHPSDTRRYIRQEGGLSKRSTKILCWIFDAFNDEVDGHYKKNELFQRGFTSEENTRIFDYTFPRFTVRLTPHMPHEDEHDVYDHLPTLSENTKTQWIELLAPHLQPHMGETRYRVCFEALVKEIKRGRVREYSLPMDNIMPLDGRRPTARIGISFGTLPEPENDTVSWWRRLGQCCGVCASPPAPFDQDPKLENLPHFSPRFNIELVEYALPVARFAPPLSHSSFIERELDDVA